MGKHEHFKVKGFWNFLLEAEIHAVPNTWQEWISLIREKYGKTQTFQIYGFLKNFGWNRNPSIHKTWEKWILIIREKYGKKTNIPKFLKYWNFQSEAKAEQIIALVTTPGFPFLICIQDQEGVGASLAWRLENAHIT